MLQNKALLVLFPLISLTDLTYSMQAVTKKSTSVCENQHMAPKALFALAEVCLLEEEGYKPDYRQACQYLERAAAQEHDLEIRAEAALKLAMLYYFQEGGLSDDKKMDHFLSVAGLTACRLDGHKEIIRISQILRQPRPYDIHQVNRRGESPLHYAAKKGFLRMLALLFVLGAAAILEKKVLHRTALFLASCNGHCDVIAYLISKGAKMDTRDAQGRSLLHAAVTHDKKEVLELLVRRGLKVSEYCDGWGLTAFYYAVRSRSYDLAHILLSHNECDAYINEMDLQGWTALHWAAFEGDLETVKYCVRNGAYVNARSYFLDTPLHCAARQEHGTIAAYLVGKGADQHAKNKAGEIPQMCGSVMHSLLQKEDLSQSI